MGNRPLEAQLRPQIERRSGLPLVLRSGWGTLAGPD